MTVGREVISRYLVETIFNEELHMIKPMIRALQSGRDDEIQKYDDLEIPRASIVQNVAVFCSRKRRRGA